MTEWRDRIVQRDDVAGQGVVTDTADVVIVGSGPGGATAARVCAEAGLDVVMIEEGPWVRVRDRGNTAWSSFRTSWRDAGFQVAKGRAFLPVLQGRCVGGSTSINGAIVHRAPEPILARWRDEFGLGERWASDELDRIYDRLDDELSVAPAPEPLLGRNNTLMREACEALGITSNAIRRNVVGCEGTAHCLQGCPHARKQSMDVTYIPRVLRAGARLYATCRVERVVAKSGRATGVRGTFLDPVSGARGATLAVDARIAVIVAASAIQTPMLLRASGVGKRSGRVGRRLQMHPGASVLGVFDEPVNMWFGATQGYETTHWWSERMKFETVGVPLEVGAARLPGFGPELIRRIADFGHIAQWGAQVRAEAHGRVRRSPTGRAHITYSMTPADVERLKLGLKRIMELMFAAGARAVLSGVHGLPEELTSVDQIGAIDDVPNDPRITHMIASHLFGTAHMGADPATSVVDPRGQSHDLPGLYVADSAIFPTNMGVNPAHTVAAMAWRIAEGIVETV